MIGIGGNTVAYFEIIDWDSATDSPTAAASPTTADSPTAAASSTSAASATAAASTTSADSPTANTRTIKMRGWLSLRTGDTRAEEGIVRMEAAQYVFLSDYDRTVAEASAPNARMRIGGEEYAVVMIDDVENLHIQLEIYLKRRRGAE